jgi:hypothetical protein
MDPNVKDLLAQTNLGELLQPSAPERVYHQPVATPTPAPPEPARSTTDPLQVHFGEVSVVGGLRSDSPVSGRLKLFALVFLGGPTIITGLLLLDLAWSNANGGLFGKIVGSLFSLGMIAFWPFIIYGKRRKPTAG